MSEVHQGTGQQPIIQDLHGDKDLRTVITKKKMKTGFVFLGRSYCAGASTDRDRAAVRGLVVCFLSRFRREYVSKNVHQIGQVQALIEALWQSG